MSKKSENRETIPVLPLTASKDQLTTVVDRFAAFLASVEPFAPKVSFATGALKILRGSPMLFDWLLDLVASRINADPSGPLPVLAVPQEIEDAFNTEVSFIAQTQKSDGPEALKERPGLRRALEILLPLLLQFLAGLPK